MATAVATPEAAKKAVACLRSPSHKYLILERTEHGLKVKQWSDDPRYHAFIRKVSVKDATIIFTSQSEFATSSTASSPSPDDACSELLIPRIFECVIPEIVAESILTPEELPIYVTHLVIISPTPQEEEEDVEPHVVRTEKEMKEKALRKCILGLLSSGKFEWASTSADDDRWTLFISGGAKRDNMLHRMHACCSVPRRTNKEEEAYLHLMATLMVAGEPREGRNGVTRSLQVPQQLLYFADISRRFPLLTTKKVFWRGVVEELIFFLKGRTDCKALAEKRVYIWEKNTSREFLDEHGLSHYPEGIAGPFYGFQWRRFGAIYDPAHPDIDYYNDQPHADQVVNLVNHIKRDPTSRRLFMSAWNPRDLDQMVLPPCHVSYQFFVTDEQKLSCILYMRSSDVFLGLPFNIASASLLTMLIASWSGLRGAASLSVVIGDAHLYENHVSAALTQLNRTPRMFPRVTLRDPAESIGEAGGQGQPTVDSRINALSVDHFILTEYDPYDTIAASMSA